MPGTPCSSSSSLTPDKRGEGHTNVKRGLKEKKKETKKHFFLILKVTFLLLALWEKSSETAGQERAGGGMAGLRGGTQEPRLELSEYSAPLEVQALAGSA